MTDVVARIADALQADGIDGAESAMLGTFVVVAEFTDGDGETWLVQDSGHGLGTSTSGWTRMGLLKAALVREEAAWVRACRDEEDGE